MNLNCLGLLFVFIAVFFIYGCACNVSKNIIGDFNVLTNFDKIGNDTVFIDLDLDSVIISGISVPSKCQSADGIALDFRIDGDKDEKYFYKIYYQNESYKFSDNDFLSYENFYGSWEDVSVGFKPVTGNFVEDFIRITGNPRNERKFYGAEMKLAEISQERLESVYHAIGDNKQWLESIEKKALTNKKSVDEQLYADALWILKNQLNKGNVNHKWKRNPRTGCYSFLLVVCTEKALEKIPDYIKDVSKTDENGVFVNPYSYFLNGNGVLLQDVYVMKSSDVLKTRAIIKPSNGVYVDPFSFNKQIDDCNINSYLCGSSHQLYENALFEQYFHTIDINYYLNNIPVVEDVKGDVYSKKDYDRNRLFYKDSDRIKDHPYITDCPCNTVKVNADGKYISIINPGNEGLIRPKKENVGVKTRVGFTFGKFIGKIKFPELLNDDNVYNGLTNAFWLIFQNESNWNNRRFSKNGYVPKEYNYNSDEELVLQNQLCYSEIDIEIVKTSRYWPEDSEKEDGRSNSDVMFCCTNWDMACKDPSLFGLNVSINYNDDKFRLHRWNDVYQASTIRTPINGNEVFKPDFYYYEIEWKPNEIIWRIGPSLDKMKVIGYTNSNYTVIPDNQMVVAVTQEFHYSDWWPPVVWDQNDIPFPKSDIEGKIFEIIVE